jgi:hypothetical protein
VVTSGFRASGGQAAVGRWTHLLLLQLLLPTECSLEQRWARPARGNSGRVVDRLRSRCSPSKQTAAGARIQTVTCVYWIGLLLHRRNTERDL